MKKATELTITKPVSAWNKPLRVDYKQVFKALSKATLHGVTGDWTNLASDAVDVAVATGFKEDPKQLAWLLIQRALSQSIFEMVDEISGSLNILPEGVIDEMINNCIKPSKIRCIFSNAISQINK